MKIAIPTVIKKGLFYFDFSIAGVRKVACPFKHESNAYCRIPTFMAKNTKRDRMQESEMSRCAQF